MTDCNHEDGQILWGITVYQTALLKITQVLHDECGAQGTIVEEWNDDLNDYEQVSETWHERKHYYSK